MPTAVADWSAVVRPRDVEQVGLIDVRCRRAVELGLVEFVDR